jgi:hypothetical protein
MAASDLITAAQSYVSDALTDASSAMTTAQSMVAAVGFALPNYVPVVLPDAPPSSISVTFPALTDIDLELPSEPGSILTFQDIPAIDAGTAPDFSVTAPSFSMPNKPSGLAEFTETAPAIDVDIEFPDPPAELLAPMILPPTLPTREEPTRPETALPSFGAVTPIDDSVAPTDLRGTFESAYQSAAPTTISMLDGQVSAMMATYNPRYTEQMAAIETQLATYLAGGTGLTPAVENAIYERSKSKTSAEARRLQETNWEDAAARGFTIPTGALLAGNSRARQAGADLNAQASRDITILQAEMEQKNLQFAVTTSTNLRQTILSAALSYHQNLIQINGQALDYAKMILSSLIEAYNTSVKAFTVKLDAYRAEAAVYETRLKAAMAGIELYKTEVDALIALTNVDKVQVDVYRARIDALTSLSNVYKAQIEAVMGRVSLEKLQLEVFETKVRAYGAQVNAKQAEWQGYSAEIEGNVAESRVFASQVDAYRGQLAGYTATLEAQTKVIEAAALTNKARAEQFAAELNSYSTVVESRGKVATTRLENQRQTIVAYQAQIQGQVANAQVANEYYKSISTVAIFNAELQLKAMLGEVDSRKSYAATIASLGSANAETFGRVASSALAGMNSLAAEITST